MLNFWDIANFQGGKCTFAPIYLKISAIEGEIFWTFLILGTMSIMVSRRIFDIRANYVERFVKIRDIANFQGGKCTFAPTYRKISAMEGEIFWAFLIHRTMSTMVSRRIFDKRANYVERFVKSLDIANFPGGKCTFAPIYLQISAMEGEIFWAFFILGTMSTMVSRRISDIRSNYVERFVKFLGYSEFSRWKMYVCTNLSQNLCDVGCNVLGVFNPWKNVYNGVEADF